MRGAGIYAHLETDTTGHHGHDRAIRLHRVVPSLFAGQTRLLFLNRKDPSCIVCDEAGLQQCSPAVSVVSGRVGFHFCVDAGPYMLHRPN